MKLLLGFFLLAVFLDEVYGLVASMADKRTQWAYTKHYDDRKKHLKEKPDPHIAYHGLEHRCNEKCLRRWRLMYPTTRYEKCVTKCTLKYANLNDVSKGDHKHPKIRRHHKDGKKITKEKSSFSSSSLWSRSSLRIN